MTLSHTNSHLLPHFNVNFGCTQNNESKPNDALGYIWGGGWLVGWLMACNSVLCRVCELCWVQCSLCLAQASRLLLFPLCWVFHEEQLWPQVLAQVLQHPLLAAAGKAAMLVILMCSVCGTDWICFLSKAGIWYLGFHLLLKDLE